MNKGKDNKPHIAIFGRRNVGKSSFINAITKSDISIVSDTPGTTTDPVKKSMEIFGIGPVILIDTAGTDDVGELGDKRIKKTFEIIKQIDYAIIVNDYNCFSIYEENLIKELNQYKVDYCIIHNKSDLQKLTNNTIKQLRSYTNAPIVEFSANTSNNLEEIIETIKNNIPENSYKKMSLFDNIVHAGDIVMLITPIDSEAPEGRMILPQVMAIRSILDKQAVNIVLKETEVDAFLKKTGIKPSLVVTDSQVFHNVNKIIPKDIPLTGFSVAFANLRGPFDEYVKGTKKIAELKNGDHILILESCTHQVSCEDIGRTKIPNWLSEYTSKNLTFDIVSGLNNINRPITDYALIIQCGGCMITRKQLINRLQIAIDAGIPITNYGLLIAYINGIFERAVAPFIK